MNLESVLNVLFLFVSPQLELIETTIREFSLTSLVLGFLLFPIAFLALAKVLNTIPERKEKRWQEHLTEYSRAIEHVDDKEPFQRAYLHHCARVLAKGGSAHYSVDMTDADLLLREIRAAERYALDKGKLKHLTNYLKGQPRTLDDTDPAVFEQLRSS